MHEIPAVGAVVFDDTGRLLLVLRAKEPARGTWSLPGGRVEPGESAEAAAIREVLEETGITISILREVGTVTRAAPGGGTYVIRDFLAAPVDASVEPSAGDDAAEAAWFEHEALTTLVTSPGLLDALGSWGLLPHAP